MDVTHVIHQSAAGPPDAAREGVALLCCEAEAEAPLLHDRAAKLLLPRKALALGVARLAGVPGIAGVGGGALGGCAR